MGGLKLGHRSADHLVKSYLSSLVLKGSSTSAAFGTASRIPLLRKSDSGWIRTAASLHCSKADKFSLSTAQPMETSASTLMRCCLTAQKVGLGTCDTAAHFLLLWSYSRQ